MEEGGANAAMTSFNRIGTRWAGAHSGLCNEVLRKEWGFVGVTLTDAVMANRNWMDVSIGLEAGNDTWLSSGDWLVSKIEGWAAEDGKLLNNLRTSAKNFLYAYANSAAMNGMNETSHVVHTTSSVETDMLIARIVLIVLTALFGLAMLVSYFMDVKKKAAPADRKTVSIVAAVIAVLAASLPARPRDSRGGWAPCGGLLARAEEMALAAAAAPWAGSVSGGIPGDSADFRRPPHGARAFRLPERSPEAGHPKRSNTISRFTCAICLRLFPSGVRSFHLA